MKIKQFPHQIALLNHNKRIMRFPNNHNNL
jgi:hypothetical protein